MGSGSTEQTDDISHRTYRRRYSQVGGLIRARPNVLAEGNSSSPNRDANWGGAGEYAGGRAFRLISQWRFIAGTDLLCNGTRTTAHGDCGDGRVLRRHFFIFAAGTGGQSTRRTSQH